MKLDTLRHLYEANGPFLTVDVDVSRDTEDARQQLDARWTSIRHELERLDVPESLRDDLEQRLHEVTHLPGQVRRTVVAEGGQVVFDDLRSGGGGAPDTVTAGPLPDLAGWLTGVHDQIPYVLARADRLGADIEFYRAGRAAPAEHRAVDGSDLHLTKVPDGDWAQDKYQQRAENQWQENARLAADAITDLARRQHARIVFLAGDVRAVADLTELIDHPGLEVVELSGGGRADGAGDEVLDEEVRRHLAAVRADALDDLTQRVERGLAIGEGVLVGPDAVADALVQGSVETLVLRIDDAHAVTVTAADHPGLHLPAAAIEAGELAADQALLAAAALTDAEVAVLPPELPLPQETALAAGVAALLRWDVRSPDAD